MFFEDSRHVTELISDLKEFVLYLKFLDALCNILDFKAARASAWEAIDQLTTLGVDIAVRWRVGYVED